MKMIRLSGRCLRIPRSFVVPRGLTLVELLIAISIIAVIAGIIFPVMNSVRARSGLTACANNLKQLYQATAMYAADYGGYLPPYTSYTHQNDPRIPLLFRTDYSSQLVNVMHPYVKSRGIWFCPADPFAGTDSHVMGVNHQNTSYRNGNFWYGPGGTADPRLGAATLDMSILNQLLGVERSPSQLLLFTDLLWPCRDPKNEDGVRYEAYYSHGERFNNIFFDGHTINIARGKHDQCPDL